MGILPKTNDEWLKAKDKAIKEVEDLKKDYLSHLLIAFPPYQYAILEEGFNDFFIPIELCEDYTNFWMNRDYESIYLKERTTFYEMIEELKEEIKNNTTIIHYGKYKIQEFLFNIEYL